MRLHINRHSENETLKTRFEEPNSAATDMLPRIPQHSPMRLHMSHRSTLKFSVFPPAALSSHPDDFCGTRKLSFFGGYFNKNTQYSYFKHISLKPCYPNQKSLLFKLRLPRSSEINRLFIQGKVLAGTAVLKESLLPRPTSMNTAIFFKHRRPNLQQEDGTTPAKPGELDQMTSRPLRI